MNFSEALNRYISFLGCSAKALADASGVSPAVISRYRSGDRVPAIGRKQLSDLARGIAFLSNDTLAAADVYLSLSQAVTGLSVDYDQFLSKLNLLLPALSIRSCQLARALSYDASYISRILSGQRRPSDIPQFIDCLSRLVARRCSDRTCTAVVAGLVGIHPSALMGEDACAGIVASWLGGVSQPRVYQSPRLRQQPAAELRTA